MPIHITKTIKTSLREVWSHKKNWIRLAFAPLVIVGASLLLVSLSAFYESTPDAPAAFFSVEGILVLFSKIFYVLSLLIAVPILEINGFRYAVLGEKRNTWWTLQLNRRFIKFFIYNLLIQGANFLYFFVATFCLLQAHLFHQSIFLSTALGLALGLFAFYLFFRLGFFKLLIAIDKPSPLKESWHLLKDHVVRLFGLTILVTLGFVLAFLLVFGITAGLLLPFDTNPFVYLSVGFVLAPIAWFFSWATLTQTYAHAYKAIQKKKA